MKPSEAFAIHRAEIRRVVESHRGCNPRVFGSVLRGEDTDSSDLTSSSTRHRKRLCSTSGRSSTSWTRFWACRWTS